MIGRYVIYNGTQERFFEDVRLNKLADKMNDNFRESSGRTVGESEYLSWIVTGEKIKNLIELTDLFDIYLCFEYQHLYYLR